MATPTTNSVGYTNVGAPGPGGGVMSGYKWGGALGTGITLTYSFPSAPVATFATPYNEFQGGWFPLSTVERGVIVAALNVWSSYANIRFAQTGDTSTTVGELRFAYTNTAGSNQAGHAYYPGGTPRAGDVWFSPTVFNADRGAMPKGGYDWNTVLHEIGHAIGLEHPFEGSTQLPRALDNYLYSIMSYTASPWSNFKDNYASFYPTTPMYYDLLALQQMYGKNTTVNKGNSVYAFVDGTRYWQAINDAGGIDSIKYSGVEGSTIDLRPGKFSAVSETIFFTAASTRSTVTIGPGVVIEKAIGGNGNDTLIGNTANNTLSGGPGGDALSGLGGVDILSGGIGNDKLTGGLQGDYFLFTTALGPANVDRIVDFNAVQDTIRLENAIFKLLTTTGTLLPGLFRKGAAAADGNDRIIYNPGTGDLIYDTNGIPAGGETKFAILAKGLAITAADFVVI